MTCAQCGAVLPASKWRKFCSASCNQKAHYRRRGLPAEARLPSVGSLPHPAWMDDAACREFDPEMFFPEKGEAAAAADAVQVCGGCPVQDQCLQFALTLPGTQDYGVWGGTTARQRDRIRQQMRRSG